MLPEFLVPVSVLSTSICYTEGLVNAPCVCTAQSCPTLCKPTVARQAPLSTELSRQRSWSHFLLGGLPNARIEPVPLTSLVLAGRSLTTMPLRLAGNIQPLLNSIYLELPNLSLNGSRGTEGETLVKSLTAYFTS